MKHKRISDDDLHGFIWTQLDEFDGDAGDVLVVMAAGVSRARFDRMLKQVEHDREAQVQEVLADEREAARVVETLAAELHRQYRATEKAMNRADGYFRAGVRVKNGNALLHDHGWSACGKRRYFLQRARLIIRRSKSEQASTLGEMEQRLDACILAHRLVRGLAIRDGNTEILERVPAKLLDAMSLLVRQCRSWHNFHHEPGLPHAKQTIQCDAICEALDNLAQVEKELRQ